MNRSAREGTGSASTESEGKDYGDDTVASKRLRIDFMTGDVNLAVAFRGTGQDEMEIDEETIPIMDDTPPPPVDGDATPESKPVASSETSTTHELHASRSPPRFQIPDIPMTDDVVVKAVDFADAIQRTRIEADLGNKKVFISKITEGSTVWNFSKERSDQIKALLESEEISDDHATGLHYCLIDKRHGIDKDMRKSPNLISRPPSRQVVTAIENVWNHDESLCYIVGPPGVGKTRTLQLLLRQFLLAETGDSSRSMRYYSQKGGFALWIMLIDDRLSVFLASQTMKPEGSFITEKLAGSMFEKSVVLLDPKEAKRGGAEFAESSRHMVVACSDDESHFPHDSSKDSSLVHFYLGLWTRDELRRLAELQLLPMEKGDRIDNGVIDERAKKLEKHRETFFRKRFTTVG